MWAFRLKVEILDILSVNLCSPNEGVKLLPGIKVLTVAEMSTDKAVSIPSIFLNFSLVSACRQLMERNYMVLAVYILSFFQRYFCDC